MEQENDYILKMAEAIGRCIAKLIGLKERGQYTQVIEEIYDNYSQYFEGIEEEANWRKLELYAKLLQLEAEIYIEKGDSMKATKRLTQVVFYLEKANAYSKTYSIEREKRIQEALEYVNNNKN